MSDGGSLGGLSSPGTMWGACMTRFEFVEVIIYDNGEEYSKMSHDRQVLQVRKSYRNGVNSGCLDGISRLLT